MEKFIEAYQFFRNFPITDDSKLQTVGYDDFKHVAPVTHARMQSFYTWHLVVRGSGYLELNGKSYNVHAGEMFFCSPGMQMRYFPKEDDPWAYVWFSLNDITACCMEFFHDPVAVRPIPDFAYVYERLRTLLEDLSLRGGGQYLALSAFYDIADRCLEEKPPAELETVRQMIDDNVMLVQFSIEQLCRDVGISHSHLLRLFKQTYGTTLVNYCLKKRLAHARELLVSTELSVQSIAYSCGFSDPVHFMKTFKKETGLTALFYRKFHRVSL